MLPLHHFLRFFAGVVGQADIGRRVRRLEDEDKRPLSSKVKRGKANTNSKTRKRTTLNKTSYNLTESSEDEEVFFSKKKKKKKAAKSDSD